MNVDINESTSFAGFHRHSIEPNSFENFDFESVPIETIAMQTNTKIKENNQEIDNHNHNHNNNHNNNNNNHKRSYKDSKAFIIALILLITPTVLFGIFICPFLWRQVHPALPVIFAYIFMLTLLSMLKTSWTDPGIIPRNLDLDCEMLSKEVCIKSVSYSLKYCETCKIFRPPRASHCRRCDNCVESEDHHCAWLNNCVGKRNYRSFFTFITSSTLLCVFVISSAVYQLIYLTRHPATRFTKVLSISPVSFALSIYCFVVLWLIGGLTCYHCSLIFRGVTTHEQIRADITKAKYPDLRVNPFSENNPFKNMVRALCQPQSKRFL